jgi:glutamate carboxypeptidase
MSVVGAARDAAAWRSAAAPELLVGPGAVDSIARVVIDAGGRSPLVVTDACVRAAGWPDLVGGLLGEAGAAAAVWDAVRANPDEGVAEACRDAAEAGGHDVLVAVGGGSVIDAAKACSGLMASGGRVSDYEGLGRFTEPGPPVVAVLTTPGSGAEISRHAVVATKSGRRFAVSGRWLAPRAVVADPRLSTTAPREVVVDTAVDSLLHAIEAFLARAATPVTDLYAGEAVSRITRSVVAATSGRDGPAAEELGLGCLLAGLAMANANAGVVHALGYPLTSEYGLSHGRANAVVSPAALRWLRAASPRRHDRLMQRWTVPTNVADAPADLAVAMEDLLDRLGAPRGLRSYGITHEDLRRLAGLAASYRPVLENTPVPVSESDLLAIYEAAWPAPEPAAAGRSARPGASRALPKDRSHGVTVATGRRAGGTDVAEMTALLARLVDMDSPSADPDACHAVMAVLAAELEHAGGVIEWLDAADRRPVMRATWGEQARPILLLGHVDTVWPAGEAARRPFTVNGGLGRGPGVFDMKAGLVQLLQAIRLLAANATPDLTVLLNADEELGSPGSEPLIAAEARRSRCALVLEPSGPEGAVKSARKGIGLYRIELEGRAAHPGLDPENGVSAILELAEQVQALDGLANPSVGTTVNVGTVSGGTRRNVVADRACAEFESRFWTQEEGRRVDRAARALRAGRPGARMRLYGHLHRQPLERTAAVARLVELARVSARDEGWELTEVAAGGVSDGNVTAGLGLPTLDGMGAVGMGAHSLDEVVRIDAMPGRAAWLARTISRAADDDLLGRTARMTSSTDPAVSSEYQGAS